MDNTSILANDPDYQAFTATCDEQHYAALDAFDGLIASIRHEMIIYRTRRFIDAAEQAQSRFAFANALQALAIAALVELGTAYYTVAPHITPDLYEVIWRAMDAGQLAFTMDVVGTTPHTIGRGVQVVHGGRKYQWTVSK